MSKVGQIVNIEEQSEFYLNLLFNVAAELAKNSDCCKRLPSYWSKAGLRSYHPFGCSFVQLFVTMPKIA